MYKKFKEILVELYERIRCFIDDEPYQSKITRGNSKSDEFAEMIIREINLVMHREKFSYQSGKLLLPTKYIVFVSDEDNSEWVGRKREGLEKKLTDNIGKQLRPVASQATLMPHNYEIKMEVDRSLQKGEIKVVHQWEERESSVQVCINGNFFSKEHRKTVKQEESKDFSQTTLFGRKLIEDEEITVVSSNTKENASIEVWRDGICQEIMPFNNSEITVGRGSPTVSVDIKLTGENISRFHGIIRRIDGGKFNLEVSGRKPMVAGGKLVYGGQQASVFVGQDITIGSYSLCLR